MAHKNFQTLFISYDFVTKMCTGGSTYNTLIFPSLTIKNMATTAVVQNTLDTATKIFNPFGLPAQVVKLWSDSVGPYAAVVANNTLGKIFDEEYVNYVAVLLFSMSLFLITLTDMANMTAPFRTFLMKIHFAFLKCIRCITIIGLFMLGTAIGQANTFVGALLVGGPYVTAAGALFIVQRMLEGFTMTVPGVTYYDTYVASGATASEGMVPFIKGTSWFHTLAQVLRDYLDQVVTTCTDSLVGISRSVGGDLEQTKVDNLSKESTNDAGGPNAIRYLWQAQGTDYYSTSKADFLYSRTLNDGAIMNLNTSNTSATFFASPLLVGVLVGLLK